MYFKESGAITMNRFLKSQEHFMKCLGLVLLFGFISFGAIGGCHNGHNGKICVLILIIFLFKMYII